MRLLQWLGVAPIQNGNMPGERIKEELHRWQNESIGRDLSFAPRMDEIERVLDEAITICDEIEECLSEPQQKCARTVRMPDLIDVIIEEIEDEG